MNSSWCYRSKNGALKFLSANLAKITKDLNGPTYVYFGRGIEDRFRQFQNRFLVSPGNAPVPEIHFAMKSNHNPDVLRLLKGLGSGVDVVSGGELRVALSAGFPAAKIIYSGVGKSSDDLELAIRKGIGQINVEGFEELQVIHKIAAARKVRASVALRVNPDIRVQTHRKIATGDSNTKFGISPREIPRCLELLRRSQSLHLSGASFHLGSMVLDFDPLKQAISQTLKTIGAWRRSSSGPGLPNTLDIGGGLGFDYMKDASVDGKILANYAQTIQSVNYPTGIRLICEPGRFLVGRSGVLLTRVLTVKQMLSKTFVIIESGMNHLMRPALYDSTHRILPVSIRGISGLQTKSFKAGVAGPVCESSDEYKGEWIFPRGLQRGDWVAILDVGAYGHVMSNDYNLFDPAAELFLSE